MAEAERTGGTPFTTLYPKGHRPFTGKEGSIRESRALVGSAVIHVIAAQRDDSASRRARGSSGRTPSLGRDTAAGPDHARVPGLPCARRALRSRGVAIRHLRVGVGRPDGSSGSLGGRVRASSEDQAGRGVTRLVLHPHTLRDRLPVLARAHRRLIRARSPATPWRSPVLLRLFSSRTRFLHPAGSSAPAYSPPFPAHFGTARKESVCHET